MARITIQHGSNVEGETKVEQRVVLLECGLQRSLQSCSFQLAASGCLRLGCEEEGGRVRPFAKIRLDHFASLTDKVNKYGCVPGA